MTAGPGFSPLLEFSERIPFSVVVNELKFFIIE